MGTVSDYIFNLIAKQVDDYGLVVWYDPDGVYAEAAKGVGGRPYIIQLAVQAGELGTQVQKRLICENRIFSFLMAPSFTADSPQIRGTRTDHFGLLPQVSEPLGKSQKPDPG